MPRGGHRPGAGRKPGSTTKKRGAIARRAAEEGVSPIDVMLHAMRVHYEAERWDDAAAIAVSAAPYCHPRLSAVQVSGGEQPVRLEYVVEIVEVPATEMETNGEVR